MKLAVIGGGDWGKIWYKALNESQVAEYAGVWDTDESARSGWKKAGLVFDSLEALLSEKNLDGVIVCTPPSFHSTLVKAALEKNLHVLVEKPFGSHLDSARSLYELAREKKRNLMVNYTFLYTEAFKELRNQCFERWSEYTSLRLSPRKYHKEIHVIDDLIVHDLSMILALSKELKSVRVRCDLGGKELDEGWSLARVDVQAENKTAHITASGQWPIKRRDLTVRCGYKSFLFNDADPIEPLKVFKREGNSLLQKSSLKATGVSGLEGVLSEFAQRLRSGEFIKDLEFIEKLNGLRKALHESSNKKGQWVEVEELK